MTPQTETTTAPTPTGSSSSVWTFMPLTQGGGFTLLDAADYERLEFKKWHRSSTGYAMRRFRDDGMMRCQRLHRVILGIDKCDPRQVDHINRDKLDNRRLNLRIVDGDAENHQNTPSRRGSSSEFRGVSWDKDRKKWAVRAKFDGRNRFLGRFTDEQEAAEVALAFRREHMPYATD